MIKLSAICVAQLPSPEHLADLPGHVVADAADAMFAANAPAWLLANAKRNLIDDHVMYLLELHTACTTEEDLKLQGRPIAAAKYLLRVMRRVVEAAYGESGVLEYEVRVRRTIGERAAFFLQWSHPCSPCLGSPWFPTGGDEDPYGLDKMLRDFESGTIAPIESGTRYDPPARMRMPAAVAEEDLPKEAWLIYGHDVERHNPMFFWAMVVEARRLSEDPRAAFTPTSPAYDTYVPSSPAYSPRQ